MLMRIGYGVEVPPTPRRPIEAMTGRLALE
jgi:hypothetical protein